MKQFWSDLQKPWQIYEIKFHKDGSKFKWNQECFFYMLLFKLMFSKRVNIPIAAINMNTDNPSISKGKQTDS